MPRMVDLAVTKYTWVTTVVNPLAPTAAELTAGKDITCFLTDATDVDYDDSDVTSERGLCERSKSETPTLGNYHGTLAIFRDWVLNTGLASTDDLLTTFDGKPVGYLYKRDGLPFDTAWASGQKPDCFKFKADRVKKPSGKNDGYLKMMVKMLQQGLAEQATVAA